MKRVGLLGILALCVGCTTNPYMKDFREVSNKPYDFNNYHCWHKSKELAYEWRKKRLPFVRVIGMVRKEDKYKHAWLEVNIKGKRFIADPTNHNFQPRDFYKRKYFYIRTDRLIKEEEKNK